MYRDWWGWRRVVAGMGHVLRGGGRYLVGAGLALVAVANQAGEADWGSLPQGWSSQQRMDWYTLSQGSRLIPFAWLVALEQARSSAAFLEPEHMEQFRFLPGPAQRGQALPLGFAIDNQNDLAFSERSQLRWMQGQRDNEPWAGITCSACHTGEIQYRGKRLRIEGGPAMGDIQGFLLALRSALHSTVDDPAKWSRFAAAVLGDQDHADNRSMLRREFVKFLAWQDQLARMDATDSAWGFGRLDAFGKIFNTIALHADPAQPAINPPDAPVSYPFLWNIHQQDRLQWNGFAPNIPLSATFDIGALARNVGEVMGAFADVRLRPLGPAVNGYDNSAHVPNLLQLEQLLNRLKAPAWPDVFPAIDPDKWEQGQRLFTQGPNSCASCHQVLPRDDLKTRVQVKMSALIGEQAIGTDPWMACNAYTNQARTGVLRGTPARFFVLSGLPMGEVEPAADVANAAVSGALWFHRGQIADNIKDALLGNKFFGQNPLAAKGVEINLNLFQTKPVAADKAARLQKCLSDNNPILAYKARPLNGVWASAPYLHNGSVPTLYDLLLPPAQRPTGFALGSREFDPQKVGYVSDSASPGNTFVFNTTRPDTSPVNGNSNAGHAYGTASLTEEQRWALVEYMKAVGGRREGNRILP